MLIKVFAGRVEMTSAAESRVTGKCMGVSHLYVDHSNTNNVFFLLNSYAHYWRESREMPPWLALSKKCFENLES